KVIKILYCQLLFPTMRAMASGNGESEVEPSALKTIASHPAMPTDPVNVSKHKITNVKIAEPNPSMMVRLGLMVSSARLATPSMPRKNQMAKGTAANTPDQPKGSAL